MSAKEHLDLLDWKQHVFAVYGEVRESRDPRSGWERWRAVRDDLFAHHPQSPIPAADRATFEGLTYYDHDPEARVLADIDDAEPEHVVLEGSAGESFGMTRFGKATFQLHGRPEALSLYWLDGYAGGLFLSFRDATSGTETYGACRYLLDTAKGADLGTHDGRLVLDFNFSYNPSCAYDPRWACPLAPPANRLAVPIRAGERLPG